MIHGCRMVPQDGAEPASSEQVPHRKPHRVLPRHAPGFEALSQVRGAPHLPHVVMPLLQAQACKAQRGLPSPPVLLGQVHRELVQDLRKGNQWLCVSVGAPELVHVPLPCRGCRHQQALRMAQLRSIPLN